MYHLKACFFFWVPNKYGFRLSSWIFSYCQIRLCKQPYNMTKTPTSDISLNRNCLRLSRLSSAMISLMMNVSEPAINRENVSLYHWHGSSFGLISQTSETNVCANLIRCLIPSKHQLYKDDAVKMLAAFFFYQVLNWVT